MSILVQFIQAEACIPLRSLVLRPGEPLSNCSFPEDNDPTSFHLGSFTDSTLISIGSFLKISNPNFKQSKNAYQLRGMATHPELRGLGAGAELLKMAEMIIGQRGGDLLWFNAREKAHRFYQKSGYIELDGKITVSEYGPHKVMYKELR